MEGKRLQLSKLQLHSLSFIQFKNIVSSCRGYQKNKKCRDNYNSHNLANPACRETSKVILISTRQIHFSSPNDPNDDNHGSLLHNSSCQGCTKGIFLEKKVSASHPPTCSPDSQSQKNNGEHKP